MLITYHYCAWQEIGPGKIYYSDGIITTDEPIPDRWNFIRDEIKKFMPDQSKTFTISSFTKL